MGSGVTFRLGRGEAEPDVHGQSLQGCVELLHDPLVGRQSSGCKGQWVSAWTAGALTTAKEPSDLPWESMQEGLVDVLRAADLGLAQLPRGGLQGSGHLPCKSPHPRPSAHCPSSSQGSTEGSAWSQEEKDPRLNWLLYGPGAIFKTQCLWSTREPWECPMAPLL